MVDLPDHKNVTNAKGAYSEDLERLSDLDLLASTVNAVLWSGRNGQSANNQKLANLATVAVARKGDGSLVFAFNKHRLANKLLDQVAKFGSGKNPNPLPDIGALMTRDPNDDVELLKEPTEKISFAKGGTQVSVAMRFKGEWKKFLYTPKFKKGHVVFNPEKALQEFVQELSMNGLIAKPTKIILLNPTDKSEEHAEMRLVKYCQPSKIGVSKPCCNRCAEELEEQGIAYTRWSQVPNMSGWTPPDQIVSTNDSTTLNIQ